jgi:uncharacterized membrane protein SirB2
MIEFYPQIKQVHVGCVMLSGLLFALRGAGVLADARWPMRLPVRLLSYAIDTTLLTAALMLLTILPGGVFANGWLTLKIALLLVYIVLGSIALKRGRTRSAKAGCFAAALATYALIYTTARTHDPLGALRPLFG